MAIAFDGFTLIPELQHWFYIFTVEKATVNKYRQPPPTDIPELYLSANSFISLLFNDDYNQKDYEWRYKEETNVLAVPNIAERRLQIYPGSWKYLIHDSTGENIFNLQPIDFTMLNTLLAYRTDETSVTMIDTTGTLTVDSTSSTYILRANYGQMTTDLSKLIYLYLDLKINGNYSHYNNNEVISDCQVLESLYEMYLLDAYYKFLSGKGPVPPLDAVCPPDDE